MSYSFHKKTTNTQAVHNDPKAPPGGTQKKQKKEFVYEPGIEKFAKAFFWVQIATAIIVLVAFAQYINPDSDAWFLAATGRYIVEHKEVPKINPFVIHEGYSIIVQQWIPDIINYFLLNNFWITGIKVFACVMYFINICLIYVYTGFYHKSVKLRAITTIFSALVLIFFATSRPTSLSFPILLIELILLEKYKREEKKKYLGIMVLLSLLEINIHAAMWPMLFIMILPYIAPTLPQLKDLLKSMKEDQDHQLSIFARRVWNWFLSHLPLVATAFIMFLVGFINPNGWRGMSYLFLSYGNTYGGISELSAAEFYSFLGFFLIAGIVFFVLYITKKKDDLDWSKIYLALGTFLMAIMHHRNMWFAILGFIPIILLYFSDKEFEIKPAKQTKVEYSIKIAAYVILAIVAGYILCTVDDGRYQDADTTPIEAVEYLNEKDKDEIVLFTGFNNGAFMEWNGYKVYMDARPELFQKDVNGVFNLYDEYLSLRSNGIDYASFLEKYGFTHIIIEPSTTFATYLQYSSDYEAVVTGNGYILYEKVTE